MKQVVVYNPTVHMICIGRTSGSGIAIVDGMNLKPGNNTVDADALERVLRDSHKSAKHFAETKPLDRRCRILTSPRDIMSSVQPVRTGTPSPKRNREMPASLLELDESEAKDYITECESKTVLETWGREFHEVNPEMTKLIAERWKALD